MTAIIFRLGRPTSVLSSPGLTGRSSNHRPGILDCQSKSDASDFDHLVSAEVGQARLRVKPGNDTGKVNLMENALLLLSQKAAFKVFENHLWRRFPLEHRGLGWVSTKRRTLNRGSRAMSRGLSA